MQISERTPGPEGRNRARDASPSPQCTWDPPSQMSPASSEEASPGPEPVVVIYLWFSCVPDVIFRGTLSVGVTVDAIWNPSPPGWLPRDPRPR